jgi:hypothetical protein
MHLNLSNYTKKELDNAFWDAFGLEPFITKNDQLKEYNDLDAL